MLLRHSRWSRRCAGAVAVDNVLEFLAGFEIRHAFRRYFHLLPSFGIATDPGVPLPHSEAAEATDLEFISGPERLNDALEQCIDNDFGILASQLCNLGYFFNEICLGHDLSSLRVYFRSTSTGTESGFEI